MRLCFALCALVLSACAARQPTDVRFRTPAQETALRRAITAFEQVGNGVQKVDEEKGIVLSKWKDANHSLGADFLFYRYVAIVARNPADGTADVRLTLQTVRCSLLDTRDPDRMASECVEVDVVPDTVQESFQRTARSLQAEVAGRG